MRPSATQSYAIVGNREEQPFTACTSQQFEQCRTFMVHRFAIDCGGNKISWMKAVAAAQAITGTKSWLENGRLKLVLASRAKGFVAPSCADGVQNGGGECLPWLQSSARKAIVLPAGFAPIGEIGARIHFGIGPELVPARMEFAKFEHPVGTDERPGNVVNLFSTPARAESGAAVAGWVTMTVPVEEQSEDAAPASGATGYWQQWQWAAAALLLMMTAVWFAWQRGLVHLPRAAAIAPGHAPGSSYARSAPRPESHTAPEPKAQSEPQTQPHQAAPQPSAEERQLANGASFVLGVLKDASERVGRLPAGALRDVLEQELHAVAQRLAYIRVAASDGRETASKAAGVFRTLIREVERIRRIAESAEAGRNGTREANTVPQTLSEAFAVLGVNPDASDQILKKLVDALRMSWHPDLAKDEADRVLREERIKQINVAWELITSSKRHAA